MRYLDSISGTILFLFGLVICLTSLRYPLGSIHSPGAGFFPLSASILLMALATVLVLTSFVKRKAMDGPFGTIIGTGSNKTKYFPRIPTKPIENYSYQ